MDFGGHATTNVVAWNMGDFITAAVNPRGSGFFVDQC